jgi:Eukaryotic protein of unknown function (DUF1764)
VYKDFSLHTSLQQLMSSKTSKLGKKTEKPLCPKVSEPGKSKNAGLDEIEDLFKDGKQKKREQQEMELQEAKIRKERNKKRRLEEAAESVAQRRNDNNFENDWVDDGLGGRHNSEGYTGRIEDGVKVFKAHVLSKPGAGTTPLCPFDCDCCFI